MSWLRRLSRDRSSKYDPDYQPPEPKVGNIDTKQTSATKDSQFPLTPITPTSPNDTKMSRRLQKEARNYSSPQHMPNTSSDDETMHTAPATMATAPDPLTRAFNEALKPYHDQISLLQHDLDSANAQIQALEAERAALHNWIDKRGLRPDLPSDIALLASNSPIAASTLATQLDRKMTMLNYSLHHLADSLPTTLPASTVTSTLATLLPKISYLSTLPAGPPSAFESIIKLAGNLNSHNTGEETEADKANIAQFYSDIDDVMVGIVGKRVVAVSEGEEEWDSIRDVKRLEKTGQFLKKEMGVRNYFLKSLEAMKGEGRNIRTEESMTRYSSD